MEFIDAHHHLWDLTACDYPWLAARGVTRFFGDPTPIQKDYLLDDFLGESEVYQPSKSVHIQVGVAPGCEVRETQWLSERAEKPEALICFADLAGSEREATLDRQTAFPRVRGVRQIIGRHADEDGKHGSDVLIDDPAFARGLRSLERRGLSFDLQLIPQQHHRVAELLRRFDTLPVAVCHAGSPWDQSVSGLDHWQRGLRQLAARPNTVVKLSGLGMFNRSWDLATLAPVVLRTIDVFGPERVMVGSNFPVDKLYHSYADWWRTIEKIFEAFSPGERRQMLVGTAATFYKL